MITAVENEPIENIELISVMKPAKSGILRGTPLRPDARTGTKKIAILLRNKRTQYLGNVNHVSQGKKELKYLQTYLWHSIQHQKL